MIEIFIKTFIFYFIVIDPIGSTPVFLVITEHLSIKEKIKTALHGTFIATRIYMNHWHAMRLIGCITVITQV